MSRVRRALGWMLILTALACARGQQTSAETEAVQDLIAKAREENAQTCSPKALALAEANAEFARLELTQGNQARAAQHVALAAPNAKKALRDSVGCASRELVVQGPADQDKDGIPDLVDSCPSEPEDRDAFQDEDGCPDNDNDQDKIADRDDGCPLLPEDADGFEDENGCPDDDNDRDLLADQDDGCPNDPEDKDSFQDEDGCPDNDNDQDKIADQDDKCINDPETYNEVDDQDGCPDYKLIAVTEEKIELTQKIFFAKAKTKILEKSYPLLDEVALALKDFPKLYVRIEGHTSDEGSDKYNQKLSQGRAEAVRKYLISKGIEAARLEAVGYGEAVPIDTNSTEAGREKNRRVEFFLVAQ